MDQTSHSAPTATAFTRATEAASSLRTALPEPLQRPHVAIICGSGLGGLQHALLPDEPKVEISYEKVPGLPKLTVEGHEGKFVFGYIGDSSQGSKAKVPVVLLVGRAHFYEGHTLDLVIFATRVCKCLDVRIMVVTNAAGGLNPDYNVGDLVLLNDHLNLAGLVGMNPLRGPNESEFGVRFPPLSDAYDLELRRRVHGAWDASSSSGDGSGGLGEGAEKRSLREGVYAFVSGPSYETRAECRMLRLLGADVVGMSTVPEVIAARHCGMRVLAMSLVTNKAVFEESTRGDDDRLARLSDEELGAEMGKGKANHEEVLKEGLEAAKAMQGLIVRVVAGLENS